MALTETGIEYAPYEELGEAEMLYVDSEVVFDREKAAREGWALERLVFDEEADVRYHVAHQGYGSAILKDDPSTQVRIALASEGLALDALAGDENWRVRQVVAAQGYGLDALAKDPDNRVRLEAQTFLGSHALSLEDWVRENPVRCATEAGLIASLLLQDVDLVNTRTGMLAMPDISGEEPVLYGVMWHELEGAQAQNVLDRDYAGAGMWARESVPAPGTGAENRMGFSDSGDYESLLSIATEMSGQGGWERDTPAAVERFLARGASFGEHAGDRSALSLDELSVSDMEHNLEDGSYQLAYDGTSSVVFQPFMTDTGIVWDWETNIGGARYMGREQSISAAIAKAKASSAASRRTPVNKVVENEDRLPEPARREAAAEQAKASGDSAKREVPVPAVDRERARESARRQNEQRLRSKTQANPSR